MQLVLIVNLSCNFRKPSIARPRCSLNPARVATRSEDLSKLSSEVLKLRLQSLNLPITGSKAQLFARLKRALTEKASQSKRRPGRPQCTRSTANKTSTQQPSSAASGIDAVQGRRLSIPEDNTLSDNASQSSIEDMLQSDAEEDLFHTNQSTDQRCPQSSAAFCHRRHCLPVCAERSASCSYKQRLQSNTLQPNS